MSLETPDIENPEEHATGTRSTLERTLSSVMEAGRVILAKRRLPLPTRANAVDRLIALCKELLEHRGEASGLVLAGEIADGIRHLSETDLLTFFLSLANDFDVIFMAEKTI